jgi:hypothetical protein
VIKRGARRGRRVRLLDRIGAMASQAFGSGVSLVQNL